MQWTFRWWSEVGGIMAWLSSHGRFPTCDLVRTVAPDVHDDDLIVLLANPHLLADVVIWHRVLATVELNHWHALAHLAADAEGCGVRLGRQRVEPLAFLRQPFDRRAARDTVRA